MRELVEYILQFSEDSIVIVAGDHAPNLNSFKHELSMIQAQLIVQAALDFEVEIIAYTLAS